MTLVKSCHLGDGAYVSFCTDSRQFGFAANDHRNVSVWVDPEGMVFLARLMAQHFPAIGKAMKEAMEDQS